MALILDNTSQLSFHTDISEIMKPFKDEFKTLNWILTFQEYIILDYDSKGDIPKLNHEEEIIHFYGSELFEYLEDREVQFIWGLFCGTKKRIPSLNPEKIPYDMIDGKMLKKPDEFLLPESEIEIICFDSTSTIIRFRNPQIEQGWKSAFTEAKVLKKQYFI